MKKILIISLSVILISGCISLKINTKSKVETFTVVSYNVENLFDFENDSTNSGDDEYIPTSAKQWTEERYENKLSNLAKVIYSVDSVDLPEIVGLYEIENSRVISDLINTEKLVGGNYGIVHEESPDFRGIDVALIYKKDIFQYISHKAIPLKLEEDTTFRTRDILYVKGNVGKDTFHIFVNHWPSRRGGQEESEIKRDLAAINLRNCVDSIFVKEPNANIIIMGDMNDEPLNKSLEITLNAKNNKPPTSNTELYNLMYDMDLNNEGTYSFDGEWNMIDNLIVSKNLLVKEKGFKVDFDSGKIFNHDFLMYFNAKVNKKTPAKTYGGNNYYGGYSDHLPIYMIMHN